MTTSLTQQFATEYAKKVVPGVLRAIRINKLANKGILIGAIAASYLHQAHFLETLGAGIFSWIVPGVFDLGIVSMLTVTQTVGMAEEAKKAALKILIVVVLISGTVNFLAPGELIMRIIFAVVVALVAGVEWVSGKIRPDFKAIETHENQMASTNPTTISAAPSKTTSRMLAPPAAATVRSATAVPDPQIHEDNAASAGVPQHLLPVARFSVVQHEQTTGQPITADELAVRMSVTLATAGQLLDAIRSTQPIPGRINGHTPTLAGGIR
ncbi:DUF2637 domain-containing protein [Actinoplanes sp. NPDC000266]